MLPRPPAENDKGRPGTPGRPFTVPRKKPRYSLMISAFSMTTGTTGTFS